MTGSARLPTDDPCQRKVDQEAQQAIQAKDTWSKYFLAPRWNGHSRMEEAVARRFVPTRPLAGGVNSVTRGLTARFCISESTHFGKQPLTRLDKQIRGSSTRIGTTAEHGIQAEQSEFAQSVPAP